MAGDQEVVMGGADAPNSAEAQAVAEKPSVSSSELGEERAAKRLRMDDSALCLEKDDVSGLKTEDSAPNASTDDSAPASNISPEQVPLPKENNDQAGSAADAEVTKPEVSNGSTTTMTSTEPRKGVAPIKKEYDTNLSYITLQSPILRSLSSLLTLLQIPRCHHQGAS